MSRIACLLVALGLLAAAAPAADAVPGPVTADRDRDGRVDTIVLPGAAAGAGVPGRTVTRRRAGTLTIAEARRGDTGSRPRVRLAGGRTVRATDGAAPRLLQVSPVAGGLVARFSEPVRVQPGGVRVMLAGGGTAVPDRVAVRGPRLAVATAAARPAGVWTAATAVRDRAGNAGSEAGVAVPDAATPPAAAPAPPASTTAAAHQPAGAPAVPPAATATGAPAGTPAATAPPVATATPAPVATAVPTPTPDAGGWVTLANPIDPRQQTDLEFCERSHYLQPWRAYLDTPKAAALGDALGVNLNVDGSLLDGVTSLLSASGFERFRYEVSWDAMRYDDPTAMADPLAFRAGLRVTQLAGLRPLILLNANHGAPGPIDRWWLTLAEPAAGGARTVRLDAASARRVVAARSGLADLGDGRSPSVLFTGVASDGTATLSRPLPKALPAGPHAAATLRFEPFARPLNADGTPNAAFEATLAGWLDYVGAVTREAAAVYGDGNFDVEIWNELSFGSDFLDAGTYYDPLPARLRGSGEVTDALLRRTVAYLRDPAHGVSRIGIGDGFANQTPFAAGSTAPDGLTALGKHPYAGPRLDLGGERAVGPCRPVDALGRPEGTDLGGNRWRDDFTPRYVSYFPEYYLNAIQTEHMVRDLSPITTRIGDVAHGRATAPAGGKAPELWITETNMDPELAGLSGDAARRMQTKAALRTLVAFVNKGATAVDFYAADGERFGLLDGSFLTQLLQGRLDLSGGGSTVQSLRRLVRGVGAGAPAQSRSLTLDAVADRGEVLVAGDGTAAHPDIHPRDWTAVFPFQSGAREFKVAAYVMTRDVATDLAPVTERLTLGGLDGAAATVAAYDPVLDRATPAKIVARTATTVTVEAPLTDSVRVLTVTG